MNRPACPYFLNGYCKYGSNCYNSHTGQPKNLTVFSIFEDDTKEIPPIENTTPLEDDFFSSLSLTPNQSKLCKNFLNGKCDNPRCEFVHGYGDRLINVSNITPHSSRITNLIKINNKKFLSSDEKKLKVFVVENSVKCIFTNIVNDSGRIGQVFIYDKLIFICKNYVSNTFNEEKIYRTDIVVFTDSDKTVLEIKSRIVHDLHYIPQLFLLFVFGENNFEIFQFNEEDLSFSTCVVINVTNSVISSLYINGEFLCGLENGYFSSLKFNLLKKEFEETMNLKVHNSKVNKMIQKEVNKFTHYIISGSDDCTVKVTNMEKQFAVACVKQFSFPVVNIFVSYDYFYNEIFCIALDNGFIDCLDNEFEVLFDIPYNQPDQTKKVIRYGITLDNPQKNDKNGDFFVLSKDNSLECNMWIYFTNPKDEIQSRKMNYI